MKYANNDYNKENMAKVVGRSLPISTKFSVEICDFVRGKSTTEAKEILKKVIDGKKAVPFNKFNRDLSHKTGMGPGRYPKKSSIEILKLVESVEANAQFKGLNTSSLYIKHICAHLASRPWRYGRQRRRKAKRTHLEIVVEEKKKEEKQGKVVKPKPEEKKVSVEISKRSSESLSSSKELDKKPKENKEEIKTKEEIKK